MNKRDELLEGANNFAKNITDDSAKLFEQTVVDAFLDKLNAGIEVPAFPQFRDMNEMFLSNFEGLEKINGGYIEAKRLTLKSRHNRLPEVAAIEENAESLHAQKGGSFQLRICVTGPYTLASFFPYRNSHTYSQLGQVLSEIVEENVFSVKYGKVALVSVDEPLFGIIDDPLIERNTEGRESLLAAWESIMKKARNRNAETCIHLHCTSDDLFWTIKSLRIVESHVSDPLYEMETTKQILEKEDKMLKASIGIADFDQLIMEKLSSNASGDDIADVWRAISKGSLIPETFLEDVNVMKKRLVRSVERFGLERVVLAGAECGLRGFPTYASAIEYLKRIAKAVESIKE